MQAYIDRIEGTIAVLIFHYDEPVQVNVPLSLLPPGCREGDILRIEIDPDPAATEAVKERVAGRIENLKKRKFFGNSGNFLKFMKVFYLFWQYQ